MSETLYVIDTFSLVFQVFHGIPTMTSPSGQPTNAAFGFTRDLLNILKSRQPTYLVCAMDLPGRGVRDDIYPEYKANRSEMPEDLQPQIPIITEIIEAFGIPVVSQEGWEADDVLATLARRAEAEQIETCIVTGDKDARQLVSPLIRLYNVRKNTYLDEAGVLADWGVRPDQVVDFQALVGDAVDNVPGVPLIGPKKASALLNQFGNLEDVLAHADEAPGKKLRENLKTYADQARMSRQLVELNTELELDFNWESARTGQMDVPRLAELFRECGFRRFIDEVRELAPADATVPEPLLGENGPQVQIVTDAESLQSLADRVETAKAVAIRLESTGLSPATSEIAAMTIASDDQHAAFIPLTKLTSSATLSAATVWEKLQPLLAPGQRQVSGHDLKNVSLALRAAGLDNVELGLDTMVGSYLLESGSRSHSLSHLVDRYFGSPLTPLSRTDNTDPTASDSKSSSSAARQLSIEDLAGHSAEEACLTVRVTDRMREELEQQGLWKLYDALERPLIEVLVDLEHTGIRVDAAELQRQNDDVSQRIEALIADIHAEAGEEFNIDSPKQLGVILFDKLELPVLKKTKTGPSTDQSVLEQLAEIHPLPAKIIEHRHLVKLKGTYLDALPRLINPATGRIHASFNQVVAATGRLSSSNPNLQNIPIRTPEGERIRRAFVPGEPGWKLICADYSQVELRMLAHFCQDPALLQAFSEGIDIHRAVAADVFNVSPDQVDSSQRRIAKAVNFGVIYGQTPWGLSAALGITREEAATFIEDYFERYIGVVAFIDATLAECRDTGFARTILGRRRAISGIPSKRGPTLSLPERTAVNTVIQGSAADLIKQAMINIHRRLQADQHPARMLLQIHDELVFECPAADTNSLIELVRSEMETALPLSVPLEIDIATGDNWLDAKG
jgi:DNA polymerase-1